MTQSPPLIGLIGHKRVGKDTFAQRLIDPHGYVKIAFADPLRALVEYIDPIVDVDFWADEAERVRGAIKAHGYEATKDVYPEYRRLLKETGMGVRDILGEDIWVDAAMRRVYESRFVAERPVVVTDVRMHNEAEAIREAGGILVRIVRDTGLPADDHRSETELDDYEVNFVIGNNKTLAALQHHADTLVQIAQGLHPVPMF